MVWMAVTAVTLGLIAFGGMISLFLSSTDLEGAWERALLSRACTEIQSCSTAEHSVHIGLVIASLAIDGLLAWIAYRTLSSKQESSLFSWEPARWACGIVAVVCGTYWWRTGFGSTVPSVFLPLSYAFAASILIGAVALHCAERLKPKWLLLPPTCIER
jgi:hypothetical protein